MGAHSTASLGARHPIHNWEYADQTAREAATDFDAVDVYKVALQLDGPSYWVLTAITPTWVQIGGPGDVWVTAPTTTGDAGVAGQKAYDTDGFLYVCIDTNTWVRFAGSTWS